MIQTYLASVGLPHLQQLAEGLTWQTLVADAFMQHPPTLSNEDIKKIYFYDVPKVSPDGSCSILEEKQEEPYNLAYAFELPNDFAVLKNHPQTIKLWCLQQLVIQLQKQTSVDWLGIYRKITKPDKSTVLVKEAYIGKFSRAEFPLTKDFAKKSNNATVGMSGKAVLIEDVSTHAGPYYICDGEVRSEFCAPILHNGEVIGIIDAESFTPGHFTPEITLQIAKVCDDLGKSVHV